MPAMLSLRVDINLRYDAQRTLRNPNMATYAEALAHYWLPQRELDMSSFENLRSVTQSTRLSERNAAEVKDRGDTEMLKSELVPHGQREGRILVGWMDRRFHFTW